MKKTILAVIFMAVAGMAYAQDAKIIATVNGEGIKAQDVTKKLWWQASAQALSDMIDEKLLLAEAARLKVSYDAKELDRRYSNLISGYKDTKEVEKNLAAIGWTIADLKNLIKDQILIKNTVIAAKKISITDADVRSFFDQNKDKLAKPEAAKLRQIFVTAKTDADDAYLALSAGADFAKLSSLKSADENLRKNAGDVGMITKGMMVPELEKEIFTLKPGQYTKPLAIGNGFTIFKMEAMNPAEPAKLDATLKANLKEALLNQTISQKLQELVMELRGKAKIELK